MALRPNAGHGLLIHEVSRSHTTTRHSRYDSSGRLMTSSQRPLPDNTQHSQQTSMPSVGFEPTISAGERPQTYALDGAASGTGNIRYISNNKLLRNQTGKQKLTLHYLIYIFMINSNVVLLTVHHRLRLRIVIN